MSSIEAIILGLIQGFTEFLPVSSSGHLAIASALFGLKDGEDILSFTVLLHVATVISTIVVLWREILALLKGLLAFKWNEETQMIAKILLSAIPVGFVGLLYKDKVEAVFGKGTLIVGCMLILTAVLLIISYYAKPRVKEKISFRDAFIIGLAQACAVMPGLSRSGSTIATGITLGNKKESVAKFSFLMVLIPVLGEALLDIKDLFGGEAATVGGMDGGISVISLMCGFVAAFVSGTLACKWMIGIVKKGKLIYFAYYCIAIGLFAIIYSLMH